MFDAARMAFVALLAAATAASAQAPAATTDPVPAATARKAGPLPGNGKDSNPESRARIVSGDYGNEVQKAGASPAPGGKTGTAGKPAVGASANPTPDGSGNKSFFESRSNTNPRTTSPIVNSGRTGGTAAAPATANGAAAAAPNATPNPAPVAPGSIFKN